MYWLHDPDETRTYTLEWASALATGDTIKSASWVISPPGPVLNDLGLDGTVARVKVSNVTLREVYRLTCHVETIGGEQFDKSVVLRGAHK